MTKKIMFFLTASLLSIGMLTGCSGGSSTTTDQADNDVVSQSDNQVSDDTTVDNSVSSSDTSATTTQSATDTQNTTSGYISEEEATSIALAKVDGATESDLRIHKDTDDGVNIYEGSIWYDGMEYDFEIDAATGEIIDWSSEKDDSATNTSQQNSNNTSNDITEKKASKIALKQVDGATESDLRIHKDTDDGKEIYEGSIIYNEMEYEFEIDAQNGDILEWSSESVYDD